MNYCTKQTRPATWLLFLHEIAVPISQSVTPVQLGWSVSCTVGDLLHTLKAYAQAVLTCSVANPVNKLLNNLLVTMVMVTMVMGTKY